MDFQTYAILSFTIVFGALIGLFRFRKIDRIFIPFIVLMWLGLGSETISYILIKNNQSNLTVYNIYGLIEAFVILWLFRRWRFFRNRKYLYYFLQVGFGLWWVLESFVFDSITNVNSSFLVYSAFIIVVLSILTITDIIAFEGSPLYRNPKFLICFGFIFFFTISILLEMFLIYGNTKGTIFRISINEIFSVVNAITNIIFAISILWMPRKPKFIKH